MSSATLQIASRTTSATARLAGLRLLGPLLAPSALLIGGALIGLFGTLDMRVAQERLGGLVAAAVLSVMALLTLQRLTRAAPLLLTSAVLAAVGGGWVIAATGPDVFRGSLGGLLQVLFGPLFGSVRLTDPVEVANTRFIIGYNGLADLCLVVAFTTGALLLQRPKRPVGWFALAMLVAALTLLVGTGSRGGLTGLLAGVCTIGIFTWPRRWVLLVMFVAPFAVALVSLGLLDKGLEFSSTSGRFTYWSDLARLLVEYPLTGVGLGVDTANRIALVHEINPDPERIFYAHNTFVQAYLEQGPLGALGMLLVPVAALAAALAGRQHGVVATRRAFMLAGLGIVGGLEAHGLTDQVLTTNVGTGLVLLGLAATLAALTTGAQARLTRGSARAGRWLALAALAAGLAALAVPAARTQVLLNIGGLHMNRALAQDAQAPGRPAALAEAESTLAQALDLAPDHPAVLRDLARVRAARYDDAGSLAALRRATESPRLDAFDMLQIAHVYRDAGFAAEAYAWAARAYAAWGRPAEDAVMRVYAENTLTDDEGGHRARTLAEQGEAAMRARAFGLAADRFQQALTFAPDNAYLLDRLGGAQRAIVRYGPGVAPAE